MRGRRLVPFWLACVGLLASSLVTDAGLLHLKGLTELRWLGLGGTHVTDG
jgi:hypothetical protein